VTATVFTIAPGRSFVDALAAGLAARAEGDPLALADTLVLLPTRRAMRALADAFLRVGPAGATILPRMLPIGDMDDDEISAPEEGSDALALPPAIPPLRRNLLLTKLVMGQKDASRSPAQAARLAAELARLLDQVETEGLSFDALAKLVPDRYAAHWQVTVEFLKIVTQAWPEILAQEGRIDPARRRNLVLAARIARWRATPPAHPVIAAGSTGSIKATAELLACVATLPSGAVILPGLDRDMDEDTRARLTANHPQFAMMRFLDAVGVTPDAVGEWGAPGIGGVAPGRAAFVAEAMRPADARPRGGLDETALDGVVRIDCPGPQEEAATVALVLRWALEQPDRTAALVTPDRALARRTAAELARWGIAIDDSAGTPLADTAPGVFLRHAANMIAERAAPAALLAALKHPLAGGDDAAAFRARVRALEVAALRGPRPAPGFDGIAAALGGDEHGLKPWLATLERASREFAALIGSRYARIDALLAAHVAFAEALAGPERLWAHEAGEALALLVDELAASARDAAPIDGRDWPGLLEALLEGRVVRPRFGRHPRLAIWGPLEARLQRADVLVLGGLNEGTWPPDPGADPWMSRPMRADFGLPPPEWRVGLSAHDFAQAFSAPTVVLTRATRVDGTPTVPSRWLLRLEAIAPVLRPEDPHNLTLHGAPANFLALALGLDAPAGPPKPVERPRPCPPVAVRPKRLSATQVETWMRDPYAIYARHVLGLRALDPIDADPGAAERGEAIHAAMDRFLKALPDALPADALDRLLEFGRLEFAPLFAKPGVWAFWWPRFERVARWVVETEHERRAVWKVAVSEATGKTTIGGFDLSARVDRIDRGPTGLAIVDYKTGSLPPPRDIALGLSPQLALEAVIAERGGFDGVAGAVDALSFWRLSGGPVPGEDKSAGRDIRALIEEAAAGLARLIAAFARADTPYLSQPSPRAAPRYSDYRLLARVKEWSAAGGGE
jgi:ATP-dependent helicase/nuclease subunit B